jgi:hypothetical protein
MTLRHLNRTASLGLFAAALAFAGCDTGEPDPINPEELITEVTLTLTNQADASDEVTITASDPDGDGAGLTFSPDHLHLTPGATYSGTITLLDTVNDEDITEEVEEEAEEHLFRYTLTPSGSGTVMITDEDANGFDVGLAFELTVDADASGDGELNVVLYHFDEEPKTGNDATSDEIDVDIDFPVMFE